VAREIGDRGNVILEWENLPSVPQFLRLSPLFSPFSHGALLKAEMSRVWIVVGTDVGLNDTAAEEHDAGDLNQ